MLVFAGHRGVLGNVWAECLTVLRRCTCGRLVGLFVAIVITTITSFAGARTTCWVVIIAVFLAKTLARAKGACLTFFGSSDTVAVLVLIDAGRDTDDGKFITKTVGTAFMPVETIVVGGALESGIFFGSEVD